MPRKKEKIPRGKFFKDARISVGMTQEQVAEKMGVNQAYIYQIENNKSYLNYEALVELAEILHRCPKGFVKCKNSKNNDCSNCKVECPKCPKISFSRNTLIDIINLNANSNGKLNKILVKFKKDERYIDFVYSILEKIEKLK